jgi:hypothetical protein
MAYTLDINYLKSNIQTILNRVHTNPTKRIIKEKHDRLSFACPICGDSAKDNTAKRGHLFLNNLYYKCYNEDCRSTFTKLCKSYDIQLDPNKKLDLINYIDTNFHSYKQSEDDFIVGKFSKLIKFEDLQHWFDSGDGPLKSFKRVQFGSKVYTYLIERGIPDQLATTLFFEGIKHNGKWSEPYVVFVNMMGDKVIGMQERNLQSGLKRRFKIWKFEELYENVYLEDLDVIEAISYNKLSYLFNILNIDFEGEITIFEGYIDSIFMPNSIGAVGINTDYSFLVNNDLNIRFFFDNDDIGKRKSNDWLKKGFNVFLWEKLINDLSKKDKDPHAYKKWFNLNIKDLNKLMQVIPIHWKELNKYFSTSQFDSLYLSFEKKQKFKKHVEEINIHKVDWDKKIKELKL